VTASMSTDWIDGAASDSDRLGPSESLRTEIPRIVLLSRAHREWPTLWPIDVRDLLVVGCPEGAMSSKPLKQNVPSRI